MIAPSKSPITLVYGAYGVAGYTKDSPHAGTDFSHSPDNKIYAPEDAEVVFTGELGTAGQATDLVADNRKHRMCHQSQILVSVGQKVKKGQVIGIMGETGRWPDGSKSAFGVHLHWVLWVNGVRVNGMDYVNESGQGDNNMAEKITVDTSRILTHGIQAKNGIVGRSSCLDGSNGGDSLVGRDLTNGLIQELFLSQEGRQWRDSNEATSISGINKRLQDYTVLTQQPPKEVIKEVVVEKPVEVIKEVRVEVPVSVPTADLDSFTLGQLVAAVFKRIAKLK